MKVLRTILAHVFFNVCTSSQKAVKDFFPNVVRKLPCIESNLNVGHPKTDQKISLSILAYLEMLEAHVISAHSDSVADSNSKLFFSRIRKAKRGGGVHRFYGRFFLYPQAPAYAKGQSWAEHQRMTLCALSQVKVKGGWGVYCYYSPQSPQAQAFCA